MRFAVFLLTLSVVAIGDDDPVRLVEKAVDQPTPSLRAKAAAKLAGRADIDLDRWLNILQRFGRFRESQRGARLVTARLQVGRSVEQTELQLYVPRGYEAAHPSPLLVAFHGTGGRGRGMHLPFIRVADQLRMLVLAPSEAGKNVGYAFAPRERESVMAAIRWMRRRFNVDENRIYLVGSSRGGHLAWDLALRHRDRFAAIAPMLGAPRVNTAKGQNNLRYVENVADLPIRQLQGMRDKVWLISSLRMTFARLDELAARDAKLVSFENLGHDVRLDAVDWFKFLGGARRDPAPRRVVRAFAKRGEGRAFWAEVLQGTTVVKENFRIVVQDGAVKTMEDDAYKRLLQQHADAHTATLRVSFDRGSFEARGDRVARFRLLLTQDMFEAGRPVRLTFNGKRPRKSVPRPSKRILLAEFVERFDRTFLPVAELRGP